VSATELVERYQELFHEVVALNVRKGLTPEQGLQGELRKAVHSIEQSVSDQGLAELSVLMLMARRHEKDYMLRGDEKYLGEIAKRIEEFKAQMLQFSMAGDLQTKIIGLWQTYYNGVKTLVEADREIKAKSDELQEAARQLEEKAIAIAAAAATDIVTAEQAVLNNLALTQTFLISILCGGIVLGCAISLYVVKRCQWSWSRAPLVRTSMRSSKGMPVESAMCTMHSKFDATPAASTIASELGASLTVWRASVKAASSSPTTASATAIRTAPCSTPLIAVALWSSTAEGPAGRRVSVHPGAQDGQEARGRWERQLVC
jgi:hypothetical protein